MSSQISFGHATETGKRERNEDRVAFAQPDAAETRRKGLIAALADGVGGGENGGEAAQAVVRGLIQDYYATPDTWEPGHAVQRILAALNRWLYGQSVSRHLPGGYASTLTALVFRGQRYCLAHVGDSRAYLLRGNALQLLTTDHVWSQPGMEHVLRRGMGLDEHIVPDISGGRLQVGDVFILMSDGVWGPLGEAGLRRLAALYRDPEILARELVQNALRMGGQDNATVLVARVDTVPEENLTDELAESQTLTLPERLKPGHRLDDFEIEEVLHDSRETLLYLARQSTTGRQYVLKTLKPIMEGDAAAKSRLLSEEWLGKRLQSPYFPQIMPLPARNYLYYAQEWQEGRTLGQALAAGEHFSVTEAVTLGIRLGKGLSALHRLDILHRDIKPENLHLSVDNKLRILDLGVAACPVLEITAPEGTPGTPSYMAPELLSGSEAGWRTDLYAAGVTLYHLLTRKYPYGEIEPFQHPKFGEPTPPGRYRTDIPAWLENVLLKAVARDPASRFETAEEFRLALERGDASGVAAPRRAPLSEGNPLALWQGIATIAILINLLLIYLLVAA
jgi:serine/threonine protein phosphatase PrpC